MTFDSLSAVPDTACRRRHLWLLALPFVWQLGMAAFINDVHLTPFGLPFALAWQMAGVVLSSLVFALVFALDRRAGLEQEELALMQALAARDGAHASRAGHA